MRDKIVVITGASAGLGRAISHAFARSGARLGLISRNEERLLAVKRELESINAKVVTIPADVSDANEMENAAMTVESELGPIDIWINNAMVSVFSPISKMTAEEYKQVTDVTYLGVVYGTLAALKRMLPRNKGTIIQVGSALAYRGIPLQSAYCAAKHAIQGFHDSLLTELLHDKSKVKVTMIQLPALNTPQFDWARSRMPNKAQPVPPIYQPEVAADAIVWAAQHYRREYIVGFSSWKAIYGNNFFPSIADKFLARMGYKSQQTHEPKPSDQPDNLFETVPGPFGAHGPFDHKAKKRSLFFFFSKYRAWIYLLLLLLVIIFLFTRFLTRT
ncbi:MAG TPA: SDR family oxidoreductase [Chitinophagaceae bacterium]|nr:SDR family oxidoreductase [Chitinophagaceae bacterium]